MKDTPDKKKKKGSPIVANPTVSNPDRIQPKSTQIHVSGTLPVCKPTVSNPIDSNYQLF